MKNGYDREVEPITLRMARSPGMKSFKKTLDWLVRDPRQSQGGSNTSLWYRASDERRKDVEPRVIPMDEDSEKRRRERGRESPRMIPFAGQETVVATPFGVKLRFDASAFWIGASWDARRRKLDVRLFPTISLLFTLPKLRGWSFVMVFIAFFAVVIAGFTFYALSYEPAWLMKMFGSR